MTELITAINALYSTYKKVKELYQKADYLELKSHILAMNEQMLEMKELALELKEENVSLKEEIKALKSSEDKRLTLKDKAYYDKNNVGPYCPNCYDNEKYLSLMCHPLPGVPMTCMRCDYQLDDENY